MQASLAVPETPQKNKRRSWFGLVTPTRREHRPVSVAVLPSHADPQQQQQPPPLGGDDAVEQLNTTPVRRGPSDTLPDRPAPLWIDDAGYESDPNGTIKRRRHPPKPIVIQDSAHDDASPARQKDVATLAILSRNNNTSKPKPFSSRIFSRSASERATPPPPDPLVAAAVASSSTPPSSFPALSGVSALGASTSSRRKTAIPATDIDDVDIDSPAHAGPSESPMNKPLPLIPLHDNGLPLRSASLPPDASPSYNMPPVPTDIVVTPSSPLERDPFADVFGPLDGDSPTRSTSAPVSRQPSIVVSRSASTRRQTSQRGEQSPTPTPRPQPAVIQSANPVAALGLGLPETNGSSRRTSAPAGQIAPAKVSVSSPLPMRTASAGPKVTFNAGAADNDSGALKEPKVKAPRPRSFSAMLGRSPLLNLGDQTDDEDTPPSKFSWLSVHKTIKRRRSESKLNKRRSMMMGSGFLSQGEMTENEAESIDQGSVAHRRGKAVSPRASATSTLSSIDRPGSTSTARMSRAVAVPPTMTISSTSSLSSYLLPAVSVEDEASFWTAAHGWDSLADDQETMDTGSRESLSLRRGRGDASRASSLASTPLESLPEGGPAPTIAPIAESALEPPSTSRPPTSTGRGRSFSDAARRTYAPPPLDEGSISLSSSPRSPFLAALAGNVDAPQSRSPTSGPSGFRPPMSGRTSSSSSAVLGKVRSVFGRPRSNSALRYGSSDEREDGRETPQITRPGSSASAASSFIPSPALPPVRIRPEDVPQVSQLQLQINGEDDRRVVLTETPDRSPRSSYAASLASQTPVTRRSLTVDPGLQPGSAMRNTRVRASTISSGAISWQGTFGVGPASTTSGVGLTQHSNHSTTGTFGHGSGHGAHSIHGSSVFSSSQTFLVTPSTITFPTSATPPRTRSGSIRRLSKAILVPSPLQPKPSNGSLFPLPPRSQSSGAISTSAGPSEELSSSPSLLLQSNGDRRGANGDRGANGTPKEQKKDKSVISIRADDTPEAWVERLQGVSRRELAGVLAESADKFHADALNLYMTRFDFHHIALDVALRRLLMDMSLPKETQQIDRVMEAFAVRYDACEPGLFGVKDNAYVLAFSMMMLHTDAFNQHNKSKMNKLDYVKNTRLDGVHELVLETIYDNITFTPFVFIEDDNEATLATLGVSSTASPMMGGALRSGKVDVYDMIVSGQLSTLRVNVEAMIPPESPFSCMGSSAFLDVDALQRRFADAHPLKFVKNRLRRKQSLTTFTGRPASTEPGRGPDDVQTLNITKVGLVHRKDDSIVNGRRVNGKRWKSWSVILTGSQLLFFKDTMWALTLVEQIRNSGRKPADNTVQHMSGFQPDEVLTVKDCVAVWDREQVNSANTFSFVMPNGRQYLMQATNEHEMNDWVALVNYASTFRTAGIRMRAQAIDSGEAVMAGAAAAESHRRDLESADGDGVGPRFSEASNSQTRAVLFADTITTVDRGDSSSPAPGARPLLRRVGSMRAPTPVVDIAGANSTVLAGGEQLEAVIGSVKAELAAGRGGTTRTMSMAPEADVVPKSLRTDAIDVKIKQLKEAAAPIEKRLSRNLRLARNLAILTPFQKTTRDRVEAAIPELAWQIRDDRVELSKLHLWLTMLLKDQDREQREWARVRHVALQAAAKSLRGGLGPMDRRATLAHPIEIPKLALPDQDVWSKSPNFSPAITPLVASPASGNTPLGTSPSPDPVSLPLPRTNTDTGSESNGNGNGNGNSITATTIVTSPPASPQRPSGDSRGSSGYNRTSSESDYELAREYLSASSELSLRDENDKSHGAMFSASPELIATRLGDGHDEEAEDWQTTRAATKVSLATLPPVAADKIGELKQRIGQI